MDKTPALLGLMADGAAHGYDLKVRYDELFGAERPLAFGQVYSTLQRMIRDGLIRAVGEVAGAGPDRKTYEITAEGRGFLREWLATPDTPEPAFQFNLFAKTVIALLVHDDPDALLDVQRSVLMARMRELTTAKAHAAPLERLALDHALFQIEADLRWIDMTSARLGDIRKDMAHDG